MYLCSGILDNGDAFGVSVSAMADSNGDGVGDLESGLMEMTMEALIEAQSTSFFQVHIVVNK